MIARRLDALGDEVAESHHVRLRMQVKQMPDACATPGAQGGAAPELAVNAKDIGVSRHPLVITHLKTAQVPFITGPCDVDGVFDNEPFWKSAADIRDFVVVGTDAKPAHVVFCRLAANDEGFLVAMRCEAERPARIPATVTERDGPVYRDESVEVFIDPTCQARDFFQFAVNVRGATLDRSIALALS